MKTSKRVFVMLDIYTPQFLTFFSDPLLFFVVNYEYREMPESWQKIRNRTCNDTRGSEARGEGVK